MDTFGELKERREEPSDSTLTVLGYLSPKFSEMSRMLRTKPILGISENYGTIPRQAVKVYLFAMCLLSGAKRILVRLAMQNADVLMKITPAHAGTTNTNDNGAFCARDYPRSRGYHLVKDN